MLTTADLFCVCVGVSCALGPPPKEKNDRSRLPTPPPPPGSLHLVSSARLQPTWNTHSIRLSRSLHQSTKMRNEKQITPNIFKKKRLQQQQQQLIEYEPNSVSKNPSMDHNGQISNPHAQQQPKRIEKPNQRNNNDGRNKIFSFRRTTPNHTFRHGRKQ
jgi:hypothetical protein